MGRAESMHREVRLDAPWALSRVPRDDGPGDRGEEDFHGGPWYLAAEVARYLAIITSGVAGATKDEDLDMAPKGP